MTDTTNGRVDEMDIDWGFVDALVVGRALKRAIKAERATIARLETRRAGGSNMATTYAIERHAAELIDLERAAESLRRATN